MINYIKIWLHDIKIKLHTNLNNQSHIVNKYKLNKSHTINTFS